MQPGSPCDGVGVGKMTKTTELDLRAEKQSLKFQYVHVTAKTFKSTKKMGWMCVHPLAYPTCTRGAPCALITCTQLLADFSLGSNILN